MDVHPFSNLKSFGECESTHPPTCTAISLNELDWDVHYSKEYYITIRVNNTAGLVTRVSSKQYRHDVLAPSSGVVIDVDSSRKNAVNIFAYCLHQHVRILCCSSLCLYVVFVSCHCLFLISSHFGASGRLCFMIMVFPSYYMYTLNRIRNFAMWLKGTFSQISLYIIY